MPQVLSDRDALRIAQILRRLESTPTVGTRPGLPELLPAPEVHIAQVTEDDETLDPLTPEDGDDAAVAGSADCDIYEITPNDSDEPELVVTAKQEKVYNITSATLSVGTFFLVIRDKFGKWTAIPAGSGIVAFTLTEDMGDTTAGEASCTLRDTWSPSTESFTGSDSSIVRDTEGIFDEATNGSKGIGKLVAGNGRNVIIPYNCECP